MPTQSGKEKLILGSLLVVALLLGVGFWVYYAAQQPKKQETPSLSDRPPAPAESYDSKLKVTFTSDIYPPESYQNNPRLRHYVGKIQNTGERELNYVRIRVIYFDKSEKPVFEQFVSINNALKPNFIQEFQFGGLAVPADWSGKVDHEIAEFRFANNEKVEILRRSRIDSRLERPPLQQILFPF